MIDIDTGDKVFHRPSRQTWLVGYVRGKHLSACGWPDSLELLADCLLVEKATPAERIALLREMAGSSGHRAAYARRELARVDGAAAQAADAEHCRAEVKRLRGALGYIGLLAMDRVSTDDEKVRTIADATRTALEAREGSDAPNR